MDENNNMNNQPQDGMGTSAPTPPPAPETTGQQPYTAPAAPQQPQAEQPQQPQYTAPQEQAAYGQQQVPPQGQPYQAGQPYGQQVPPQYGAPQQMPYSAAPEGKGMGTASLIMGILSLVLFWAGWGALVGIVLGIAAIITGTMARKKLPKGMAGAATGGLVCGIIGLILGIIGFVSCIACMALAATPEFQEVLNEAISEAENAMAFLLPRF